MAGGVVLVVLSVAAVWAPALTEAATCSALGLARRS